jgi:hypothetical protein
LKTEEEKDKLNRLQGSLFLFFFASFFLYLLSINPLLFISHYFKSKPGSRVPGRIKIEMIFDCPGYTRAPKVTNVCGNAKDWNEKTQMVSSINK